MLTLGIREKSNNDLNIMVKNLNDLDLDLKNNLIKYKNYTKRNQFSSAEQVFSILNRLGYKDDVSAKNLIAINKGHKVINIYERNSRRDIVFIIHLFKAIINFYTALDNVKDNIENSNEMSYILNKVESIKNSIDLKKIIGDYDYSKGEFFVEDLALISSLKQEINIMGLDLNEQLDVFYNNLKSTFDIIVNKIRSSNGENISLMKKLFKLQKYNSYEIINDIIVNKLYSDIEDCIEFKNLCDRLYMFHKFNNTKSYNDKRYYLYYMNIKAYNSLPSIYRDNIVKYIILKEKKYQYMNEFLLELDEILINIKKHENKNYISLEYDNENYISNENIKLQTEINESDFIKNLLNDELNNILQVENLKDEKLYIHKAYVYEHKSYIEFGLYITNTSKENLLVNRVSINIRNTDNIINGALNIYKEIKSNATIFKELKIKKSLLKGNYSIDDFNITVGNLNNLELCEPINLELSTEPKFKGYINKREFNKFIENLPRVNENSLAINIFKKGYVEDGYFISILFRNSSKNDLIINTLPIVVKTGNDLIIHENTITFKDSGCKIPNNKAVLKNILIPFNEFPRIPKMNGMDFKIAFKNI